MLHYQHLRDPDSHEIQNRNPKRQPDSSGKGVRTEQLAASLAAESLLAAEREYERKQNSSLRLTAGPPANTQNAPLRVARSLRRTLSI